MLEPGQRPRVEVASRGVYAEFAVDTLVIAAARRLREQGYVVLDAFTPRPVVALEELVAPGRSNLNRTVFVCGLTGAVVGLGIEWWCNAWDYPLNTGGRPPFALPAYVPITFEAMVLFAAFGAFFGFMRRAGLPWLAHPAFAVPGFERASIDRFFLLIEPPAGGADELRALLSELGALGVFVVPAAPAPAEEPDSARPGPVPSAESAE